SGTENLNIGPQHTRVVDQTSEDSLVQSSVACRQPGTQHRRHILHERLRPAVDSDLSDEARIDGVAKFEDTGQLLVDRSVERPAQTTGCRVLRKRLLRR